MNGVFTPILLARSMSQVIVNGVFLKLFVQRNISCWLHAIVLVFGTLRYILYGKSTESSLLGIASKTCSY